MMYLLSRREALLLGLAGVTAPASARESGRDLLLLSAKEAESLHSRGDDREHIQAVAAKAAKAGPWSVTYARPKGLNLEPNEYFSEGPYWWPDPKNPSGPYIRRDGERNPDRFNNNHDDLHSMSMALLGLGMGAYFLGDAASAKRLSEVASIWFVEPKTRMNPELEHGQAIRGVSDGRGTGIIDTVSYIYAVQGLALADAAGTLDRKVAEGTRQWFTEYLRWMTHSAKGLDEKKSGNNHATWWAAQVAVYSGYVGDRALQAQVWDFFRETLVQQIRPDGSLPREEARTKSLSYSIFDLDAFAVVCRLAQVQGVDLWPAIGKAVQYVLLYALHPDTWKKQQIEPVDQKSFVFPALAGLPEYRALPRNWNSPWVVMGDMVYRSRA